MDSSEKKFVWYTYVKRSRLDFIEAGSQILPDFAVGISELLGIEKISAEEAEFSKTLVVEELDHPAFKRFFVGEGFKTPVTLSMIAYDGELFGVQVSIYHPNNPTLDTNACFMVAMNGLPTGKKSTVKKKRTNVSVEEYKIKFSLIDLMTAYGFDHLFKQVVKQDTRGEVKALTSSLTGSFSTQLAPLDLFFNLSDLLAE